MTSKMKQNLQLLIKSIFIICLFLSLNNCGVYKKTDARKNPINAQERARKNIEEGRGFSVKGLAGRKSGTYEFSTSNPMWRSSLEILDFLPLVTVDYSGGIIITDWYNDAVDDDAIKITIRFLSNEIQSNSIKIIVHKKDCNVNQTCLVKKIDSKIEDELRRSILQKAALLEKEGKKKKK
tara:strand:+ start:256 stop:795 length:540 start_codon:yes stop_codon:yes gene_type:complete